MMKIPQRGPEHSHVSNAAVLAKEQKDKSYQAVLGSTEAKPFSFWGLPFRGKPQVRLTFFQRPIVGGALQPRHNVSLDVRLYMNTTAHQEHETASPV